MNPVHDDSRLLPTAHDIDWRQSAVVVIGVRDFCQDPALNTKYTIDDAVDFTYLITHELKLLSPGRVALLISGRPAKQSSTASLEQLRSEVVLVEDDHRGVVSRHCLNAGRIAKIVRQQAQMVGERGILILFIATHGVTINGQHRLLAADSSRSDPRGFALAHILDTISDEHLERVLLMIDACRDLSPSVPESWHPQAPESFLQDVSVRMSFAFLISASPGRSAYEDQGNGLFTRAVLKGLRCRASALPDGWVTLNNLAMYVSEDVRRSSADAQQPESRIGSLGHLRLVQCGPPIEPPCRIVAPVEGESVVPGGTAKVFVSRPELHATVMICAPNGICYNQNPEFLPIEAHAGGTLDIPVQYNTYGPYSVHVALTADPDFLKGEEQWPYLPSDDTSDRVVHRCGPVNVTMKPPQTGRKTP